MVFILPAVTPARLLGTRPHHPITLTTGLCPAVSLFDMHVDGWEGDTDSLLIKWMDDIKLGWVARIDRGLGAG